jgi:hypothetical protein
MAEDEHPLDVNPATYALVAKRQKFLHDSWLSHVGHQRPGVKDGLPLAEAKAQALAIDLQLMLPSSENATPLFNGRDLSGWTGWEKYWSVEDGIIVARNGVDADAPPTVPSSTYLFTDKKGTLKLAAEKTGDWNRVEILVIGNRIRFAVNGIMVFDFTDTPEKLQASPIGLQLHSNGKPQEHRFRGLVISEQPEDRMASVE